MDNLSSCFRVYTAKRNFVFMPLHLVYFKQALVVNIMKKLPAERLHEEMCLNTALHVSEWA